MQNSLLNLKTCEISTLLGRLVDISNQVRAGHDMELPVVTIVYQHGQRFTGSVVNYSNDSSLVLASEPSSHKENTRLIFLQAGYISAIEIDWHQHDIDTILNDKKRVDPMGKLSRDDLDKLVTDLESELATTCQYSMKITLDKSLLKEQKKANFAGIIVKDTVKVLKDMAKDKLTKQSVSDSIKTIVLKIDQEPSLDLIDHTLTVTSACSDDWFRRKTMKQMKGYLESVL